MMKKITDEIRKELNNLSEKDYKDFQKNLIPTVESDTVIGVRTPVLRKYAKELVKRSDIDGFLTDLPHAYFDENQLHAFIISEIKDYAKCVDLVVKFLPYVDNWATCDQLSPKVFKKHREELLKNIKIWLNSSKTYEIRFGIGMLMQHFLDEDFDIKYPEAVSKIRSDEYYINMMIAWYFATALAKQYDAVIPFIEENALDKWTHNMTIRKANESFRVLPERKAYLKTLKRK